MAKNITLMGADYPDVPAVQLPQTGGGTATFYDIGVYSESITVTTDSDGWARIDNQLPSGAVPLVVAYSSGGYIASGSKDNKMWYVAGEARKSQSITITVYYLIG